MNVEIPIGEKIRKYRKKHNLTQEKMAKKHRMSRVSIARWEADINYPSIHSVAILKKKKIIK